MNDTPRQRIINSLWGQGREIPVVFWDDEAGQARRNLLTAAGASPLRAVSPTHLEHPHCAFYKNAVTRNGQSGTATVLHTPEGRLTRERFPDEGGRMRVTRSFVSKPAHYERLLCYLRDACVVADYRAFLRAAEELGDGGLALAATLPTPVAQMTARFRDARVFAVDRKSVPAAEACLCELRRLFDEQTAALAASREQADVRALWVADRLDAGLLSPDDLHGYCLPCYRQLKAARPDCAVVVEAAGPLAGYGTDGRELPGGGCLSLPADCDCSPGALLAAWPRRSLMVTLPEALCRSSPADITAAAAALGALPGARQRAILALPTDLPDKQAAEAVRALLDGLRA